MSSRRMPGKVLAPVYAGKTMLECVVERVKLAMLPCQVVVATSTDQSDDPIQCLCEQRNIDCYRGSLDDVLSRYYNAATFFNADIIVRITADCPLIDYEIIDHSVKKLLDGSFDYVSNTIRPTLPDGLDVEVFTYPLLKEAFNEANLRSEREHVTLYIKNHKHKYKYFNMVSLNNYSNWRWTVDECIDLVFIRKVYESIYAEKSKFRYQDVVDLLHDRLELLDINSHIERDEGLKKSLAEDYLI